MPIPDLDPQGFLPAGIHDCAVDEIRDRFGRFQGSERRFRLFDRLLVFIKEAQRTGFIVELVIDGSFVTGESTPSDVDLVVVLAATHDFSAELRPFEYNVVSKRRVRQAYGFDILIAAEGTRAFEEYVQFFQQVRGQPERRKGILRVKL